MNMRVGLCLAPNHENVEDRVDTSASRCLEVLHRSRDHVSFLTASSHLHRADTEQQFDK